MGYHYTIRPEALNILGNPQRTNAQGTKAQEKLIHDQTLLGWIKSKVKKAFEYVDKALTYIKETIVPIATAAAGILNAWSNFQHCTGHVRYKACAV